ncbi:cysteine synthase A [Striga asiatica]|uniref:Cysteine synthase A n=1 Tax=Striga asiatica TaxID=4170 RepID=A0A5A7PE16_STRAF|nr:cysteine synthase A [Striga asiatica]
MVVDTPSCAIELTESPKIEQEFMEESKQVVVFKPQSDVPPSNFMGIGESKVPKNIDPSDLDKLKVTPNSSLPSCILHSFLLCNSKPQFDFLFACRSIIKQATNKDGD